MIKLISAILTAAAFAAAVFLSIAHNAENAAAQPTSAATHDEADSGSDPQSEEMRGMWVSYMDLSMENEDDKSEKSFTEKITRIAEKSSSLGFNALIVQVRPFGDALYKSEYFPWSHILTGTQGEDPGYDPLEIICTVCREYGLEIHAWINPYRIQKSESPPALCADSIYSQNKELCISVGDGIYLDPSNEEARRLIADGAAEIAENYDIDGVQLDDYFYPEDISDEDSAQYAEYAAGNENAADISQWRKANVSLLVADLYRTLHSVKAEIKFGISPQGNIGNNDSLYADVESWCTKKGYIDYICPQLYYSPDNPALGFEQALADWCSLDYADGVKLYAGLAGYKAGSSADSGTWLESDSILAEEYELVKSCGKAGGIMLYSYSSVESTESAAEAENLAEAFV